MLIICNGMIRAGSTLQYNIVQRLIKSMNIGTGQGFFEQADFESSETLFERWMQEKSYHAIKAHEIYPHSAKMIAEGRMKVVYIYRDIRDVAVSIHKKIGNKEVDILEQLDRAISIYYEMKTLPNVLWQKYETVIRDLPVSVREIAEYLDLAPSERIINSVITECSLENALKKSQKMSFSTKIRYLLYKSINKQSRRVPSNIKYLLRKSRVSSIMHKLTSPVYLYDKDTLLHPGHISKDSGAVGVWQSNLPEHKIDAIRERYGAWLIDAGYSQ